MWRKNKSISFIGIISLLAAGIFLASCGEDKPKTREPVKLPQADTGKQTVITASGIAPDFSADTAYFYIEKQLSFGPRIPGSKGSRECGNFLVKELQKYADEVMEQLGNAKAYTGINLPIRNIIARFNPAESKRILLCAHWDTRPFSDQEKGKENVPVQGADDGGSGVAVLLEMARHFKAKNPNIGIDIILFDTEDYGASQGDPESFCLGSQYWAANPPIPNYMASYGILLDMVGAKNARFLKEGWSRRYASSVVDKVWATGIALGYGDYFIMKDAPELIDDHYFINSQARIPTIDIINYDASRTGSGFGAHWHTTADNMDIIDKNTLKAVGQTVLEVVYAEGNGF